MADRRELAREMYRRTAEKVREVSPGGIGHWDPAWEYVAEPSDRFMDAVDAWIEDANPETEAQVRRTARELVGAWKEAGQQYLEAMRPGPGVTV